MVSKISLVMPKQSGVSSLGEAEKSACAPVRKDEFFYLQKISAAYLSDF